MRSDEPDDVEQLIGPVTRGDAEAIDNLGASMDALDENPLPHVLTLKPAASHSQPDGAKALVDSSGCIEGTIGGGAVEAEAQKLINEAENILTDGARASLFKRRLLYGALQLDPEEVRHQGVGQFLGRVLESEAVEMLALSGGFTAVTAIVQLILATVVLAHGAVGWLHLALLWLWLASRPDASDGALREAADALFTSCS